MTNSFPSGGASTPTSGSAMEQNATYSAAVVDYESAEPLYQQVRKFIEHGLKHGAFPRNRALPSSRYLSSSLGVSRNTVNAACQELVALGLLVSKPRSGLYPAPLSPTAVNAADPAAVGDQYRQGGFVSATSGSSDPPLPTRTGAPDWASHIRPVEDPWPLDATLQPDYMKFKYPFLPGQIEPRSFPSRAWLRAVSSALDGPHRTFSLRDSVDLDDPLLVESICSQILQAKGILASPEQILITDGAQHALSLLGGLLLDADRTVAVENPGYVDAARIFRRTGARLEFFSVDRDGVAPDYHKNFDLIYVTPSHHHPTNVTLHATRRKNLLAAAARDDFLVIEDDFDSEIRFKGTPTAPMKAADRDGRVIYIGTFSKFLAPGLRLGYVVAEAPLIRELRDRRYYSSKHPSGHMQRSLGLFISSGEFHRALRQHRVDLKHKWETLDSALREYLPWPLPGAPAGGLSFWITGPPDFNATAMAGRAMERGVLISPGASYYLQPNPPQNSFRLGFNSIPHTRIEAGVQLLAEAIMETGVKARLACPKLSGNDDERRHVSECKFCNTKWHGVDH